MDYNFSHMDPLELAALLPSLQLRELLLIGVQGKQGAQIMGTIRNV